MLKRSKKMLASFSCAILVLGCALTAFAGTSGTQGCNLPAFEGEHFLKSGTHSGPYIDVSETGVGSMYVNVYNETDKNVKGAVQVAHFVVTENIGSKYPTPTTLPDGHDCSLYVGNAGFDFNTYQVLVTFDM
jgi:hypothetical protein